MYSSRMAPRTHAFEAAQLAVNGHHPQEVEDSRLVSLFTELRPSIRFVYGPMRDEEDMTDSVEISILLVIDLNVSNLVAGIIVD